MRPLLARPGTILLFAFLFLFSNLATTALIADPTFSNVAFAQNKKDKDKDNDKNALKGNKRLRKAVKDLQGQTADLQTQIDGLEGGIGPEGPQGPQGDPGPAGPAGGRSQR